MEGNFNFDVNALTSQIGEGASEIVKALTPAAGQVADSIGTTLPQLWIYGVIWQRAEGWAGLVTGFIPAILGTIALLLALKWAVKGWSGRNNSDNEGVVFGLMFVAGIMIVLNIFFFLSLKSELMHIIAPEAMLVLEIVDQAKQLMP